MKTNSSPVPLTLFLTGAALLFGVAWIAPWFTSPVWIGKPAAEFDGTVWEVFGPIFITMSLMSPFAMFLMMMGALMLASVEQHFTVLMGLVAAAILSMLGPAAEMEYHPHRFAICGVFILLFTYLSLWYWAKSHRYLDDKLKGGHGFRAVSYVFFLLVSLEACALLGNPFSGLFHYGRTEINPGSWPFLYAIGSRVAIYLACGFFFSFVADCLTFQALAAKEKSV